MVKFIIIPMISMCITFMSYGQVGRSLNDPGILNVHNNNLASEGDLYYNTDNGYMYIGLVSGELKRINDADWLTTSNDTTAILNSEEIYTMGNVGIGTSTPGQRLDVANGTVRFSDYGTGGILDTLTGTHPHSAYHLGVLANGDIVEVNTIKSSKVFYPPSIVIDVSSLAVNETLDLYAEYVLRFGSPELRSPSAPSAIPTYGRSELYYYISDLDTSVFGNYSLDDNGNFTYDVISIPSGNCTWINVVFVVK